MNPQKIRSSRRIRIQLKKVEMPWLCPGVFFVLLLFYSGAAFSNPKSKKTDSIQSQFIFPLQGKHVHSSCLTELPNGDLLACWFEGSGERNANDVVINGARLKKGATDWGKPI